MKKQTVPFGIRQPSFQTLGSGKKILLLSAPVSGDRQANETSLLFWEAFCKGAAEGKEYLQGAAPAFFLLRRVCMLLPSGNQDDINISIKQREEAFFSFCRTKNLSAALVFEKGEGVTAFGSPDREPLFSHFERLCPIPFQKDGRFSSPTDAPAGSFPLFRVGCSSFPSPPKAFSALERFVAEFTKI